MCRCSTYRGTEWDLRRDANDVGGYSKSSRIWSKSKTDEHFHWSEGLSLAVARSMTLIQFKFYISIQCMKRFVHSRSHGDFDV